MQIFGRDIFEHQKYSDAAKYWTEIIIYRYDLKEIYPVCCTQKNIKGDRNSTYIPVYS